MDATNCFTSSIWMSSWSSKIVKPHQYTEPRALADAIIEHVGKEIVLGLPLGLGKANLIANALFERAAADPEISLKIFTALTLELPRPANELQRRFLEPVIDRLFGDYPPLAYAEALRDKCLPPNVSVNEFYFLAGRWLSVPVAQQNYISSNYTHAARYVLEQGVNVVAHLVAKRKSKSGNERYSLSCNTDITPDLLAARKAGKADFLLVGEVNDELPFMDLDASLPASEFSHMLDGQDTQFPLHAPPKRPVTTADYAAGLHIARLIADGGTLQIGIGSIGDAVAHGLILRHTNNKSFRKLVERMSDKCDRQLWEVMPFNSGLYGCSEMFVDTFVDLMKAGVVKRQVDGVLLHSAFFLGPKSFYRALREMPEKQRSRISMKPVSFVNALYGNERTKRRARSNARFVNNAMMATLLGAINSDGLGDGRVVSGVGGQHDFVTQAFALDDARSIIALNATRSTGGRDVSNIRWSYDHLTIPRHLRDIIVTEYGVADLRGKSDSEVIARMLAITDSRFQDELLRQAKASRKIRDDYEIPEHYRNNTPDRIQHDLALEREQGLLPTYPFGTDFTATEQRLIPALSRLKTTAPSKWKLARLLARGIAAPKPLSDEADCLARMGLDAPKTVKERVYKALLRAALMEQSSLI